MEILKILDLAGLVIASIAWVLNFYKSIKEKQDTLPMHVSLAFMFIFYILMRIN